MPSFDLIIKNGKVVTAKGSRDFDVFIRDGKIADVRSRRPSDQASSVIDARGKLVMPGSIDPHVHFREPGMTQKEDFETGSRSAAAGGVTTVFDMPTTIPIVTDKSLLEEKMKLVKAKSLVDFGLYGAAGDSNVDKLPGLKEVGAIAFKTYTVAPPPERVKEYEGSFIRDSGQLLRVSEAVSRIGALHCVHAEDDSTIAKLSQGLIALGRRDPPSHYDSRPNFTEALAVSAVATISETTKARTHILHTSTKEALRIIGDSKARGARLTCETCPHYMYFTKEALQKFGPYAKFNPPPRLHEDVEAMWRGVRDGTIDIVASDHAPHATAEKDRGKEDIWLAPPGTPGVETKLPFLLTFFPKRGLGYSDVVRLSSTAPAEIYGVRRVKGDISKGLDGDVVIVEHKREWRLRKEDMQTKAKETAIFDGIRFTGKVTHTLLRGMVTYEEGTGFGRVGIGELLKPLAA